MMHPDTGTLQAFLDHELPPGERAEAAEHLLACESCHHDYQQLMQANALFSQSVSVLDVQPSSEESSFAPLKRGARAGTGSFLKAAGLVLALAAAASAAVPGSPVRVWIESAVTPSAPTETQTSAPEPTAVAPPPVTTPAVVPPVPAGISMASSGGTVVVALLDLENVTIQLDSAAGPRAEVFVVGSDRDPAFGTGSERIEVRGGSGGELRVRLPATGGRLEVDGRLIAERRAGVLHVHTPADTLDGAIVWR